MPPDDQALRGTGAEPAVAPPRQVVAWQHDRPRLQHDTRGPGDVQDDTAHNQMLVRSLIRAQLGLSLLCLALAGALVASLPAVSALLPGVRQVRVAGLPLTLIILGAGIYPVLMAVGWFYNRQASQLETRLIDLVDLPGRRPDGE